MKYSLSYSRTIELESRLLEKEWGGQPGLFAALRLRWWGRKNTGISFVTTFGTLNAGVRFTKNWRAGATGSNIPSSGSTLERRRWSLYDGKSKRFLMRKTTWWSYAFVRAAPIGSLIAGNKNIHGKSHYPNSRFFESSTWRFWLALDKSREIKAFLKRITGCFFSIRCLKIFLWIKPGHCWRFS